MIDVKHRLKDLVSLGLKLSELIESNQIDSVLFTAEHENAWFTKDNSLLMLNNIINFYLNPLKLEEWIRMYPQIEALKFWESPKWIGVIAAGNIPLVCFHDVISVLITGNSIKLKLSSKDSILMNYVLNLFFEMNPEYKQIIDIQETLKNFDSVIATGSNNTARYFEYYFKSVPNIIRKNRTSVAIIQDSTTKEDFFELGKDIFQYYGLGCRNVSKLYLPEGFDLVPLLDELFKYHEEGQFFKYYNNYTYHKSIFLLNKVFHYDTGFLVIKEDEKLFSPLGTLFFEFYSSIEDLENKIKSNENDIQCITSNEDIGRISSLPFGKSQIPELWNYSDGVDTVEFLLNLPLN